MDFAKGSYFSPFDLRSFVLIVLMFRTDICQLLFSLELFGCLDCNLNGFFIFVEKEGLNSKVNYMAHTSNLVLSSRLGGEVLLD